MGILPKESWFQLKALCIITSIVRILHHRHAHDKEINISNCVRHNLSTRIPFIQCHTFWPSNVNYLSIFGVAPLSNSYLQQSQSRCHYGCSIIPLLTATWITIRQINVPYVKNPTTRHASSASSGKMQKKCKIKPPKHGYNSSPIVPHICLSERRHWFRPLPVACSSFNHYLIWWWLLVINEVLCHHLRAT